MGQLTTEIKALKDTMLEMENLLIDESIRHIFYKSHEKRNTLRNLANIFKLYIEK